MESCMSNCFEPPKQLQTLMSNELTKLQDRLSRCARGCQDNVQDQISNTSSKDDINRLQNQLDSCIVDCCNTHIELIPKIFERMNDAVRQFAGSQQAPQTGSS